MNYKECPYCGASLDAWDGSCDCQKEEAPKDNAKGTSKNTYINNSTESEVCQDVGL